MYPFLKQNKTKQKQTNQQAKNKQTNKQTNQNKLANKHENVRQQSYLRLHVSFFFFMFAMGIKIAILIFKVRYYQISCTRDHHTNLCVTGIRNDMPLQKQRIA